MPSPDQTGLTIHIRGMVCERCLLVTRQLAENTGVPVVQVGYGAVTFGRTLSELQQTEFAAALEEVGFGLIRRRDELLAEHVEHILRDLAEGSPAPPRTDLRELIIERLDAPFDWAAAAYQRLHDETVAQRYSALLMLRAARLLREGELQAAEVGSALGYAHLSGFSRAFKRYWGVSPRDVRSSEES